jgi:hypothetical protein
MPWAKLTNLVAEIRRRHIDPSRVVVYVPDLNQCEDEEDGEEDPDEE